MHIPDGILPAPVAIAGFGLTGLCTWYSLKKINRLPNPEAQVPKASLLTAAFFVASWIHIPLPPTSIHLVLNGLLGVVLGYFAFPAILIGLLFQAIMFQHGGLSTLGVNAAMMGIPAMIAYQIFQLRHGFGPSQLEPAGGVGAPPERRFLLGAFGFAAGSLGLALSVLVFLSLTIFNLPAYLDAAVEQRAILLLALAHVPAIALEGLFTALLVLFLHRVKPELLES